ncbi:type II toxin-antitoxin system VapC family toxin [Tianweitania populi]|uniref:Twitching motility protein PilT n=1 Tax=Tianweitania populi TaxID=1607949 RepID=A0A8J3GIS5_9HYPH|nr:type II toxin-antitoxin system VapC family toxin [Tianweitania populi]GHD05891.1 twitching motility protein PilT [Tianweitania populi]
MRLLLDTHVAIWATTDDERLPRHVYELLSDVENDVYVSAMSVFEVAIKYKLRQHQMPYPAVEAIRRFKDAGFEILAVTENHAAMVDQLPLIHHDPFDRLMIAQSLVEALTFVSADRQVAKYDSSILTWR